MNSSPFNGDVYFVLNSLWNGILNYYNKSPRAQRRSPGYDVQRFKKIFKKLPITETDKPLGGAILCLGVIILTILVKGH